MNGEKVYLKKDIYNSMWSSKQYAGSFVALCGFDGSGKTTQTKEISRHYSQEKNISYKLFSLVIGIEITQRLEII